MGTRNTFVAAGLAAVAAGFPVAAQARPIEDPAAPVAPLTPPVVVTHDDGFQWADAGVGAAGTFLVLGSAGTGSMLVRRRRGTRALAG